MKKFSAWISVDDSCQYQFAGLDLEEVHGA